jgi:hypothetical protein
MCIYNIYFSCVVSYLIDLLLCVVGCFLCSAVVNIVLCHLDDT